MTATSAGDKMEAKDQGGPLVAWAHWIRAGIFRRLSPSARNVGQVLASFASKDGLAFPAVWTLCQLTGHTRTTVIKANKELVKAGVFEKVGHVKRRNVNARGPVQYLIQKAPPPMCLYEQDVSPAETHSRVDRFGQGAAGSPATTPRGLCERDGGSPIAETGGVSPAETVAMCPARRDTEGVEGLFEGGKSERARRGECREGEPYGALRSASPPGAAPLRAPSREADPAGEPTAAWEGKNREQPETATKNPTPKSASYSNLLTWLKTGTGDMAYRIRYAKKAGHSDLEIEAARAEVSAATGAPAEAKDPVDGYPGIHPG